MESIQGKVNKIVTSCYICNDIKKEVSNLKGKIKLKLHDRDYIKWLEIYLKMEDEWFYWHSDTIVSHWNKTEEEFYDAVIKYLSDVNNIKMSGEELMREAIENKMKNAKNNNKDKIVKDMLKKLKEPIEIEVKI